MNKIKRALISVSNKTNLKKIIPYLKKYKIEIISSGGTYKKIKKLGFECKEISNFTGFPEILDGRVKTLHPKIYAGILNKADNKSHNKQLKKLGFQGIDLVIINFYPFKKTTEKSKNHKKVIENIDIGGPSMVRAAAKNYNFVTVITNTNQYDDLINELKNYNGSTSLNFRKRMSEEAFYETGYYDSLIANYFSNFSNNYYPKKKLIHGKLISKLRYGENPHQSSSIYSIDDKHGLKQLGGKRLSFNNYNDIFAALNISKSFPNGKGAVIVKHSNPCGVSINIDKLKSYKLALSCDPISAFGGIVSLNFKVTKKIAIELNKTFLEVVIGESFEKEAIKILKKKKNLIIISAKDFKTNNTQVINSNSNYFLLQSSDKKKFNKKNFKVVSKTKPNKKTFKSLIFAFNVCRYVKSNAIVIANDDTTVGIGSGQPSRLDSCQIAINKMKKFHKNIKNKYIVSASDAFFPFVDGVEKLVQSGVKAIIQPSGSIRDKEIIKFANRSNTVLVFSKTRHFKH